MNTDDKVFMSLDDIIKQNKSPKSKGPGSVYSVKSTASRRSRRRRDGQRGRGNAGGRGSYQVIGGWNRRGPVVQQRGRGFQSLRYRSQMPNLRFGVNSSLGNRFRQRYGVDQRALFPSSYKSVVYNRNLNQQYMQNRVRHAAQFLRERQSQNRQFYQQNYRGQGARGYRRGNPNVQQGGYRSQYSFNTTARHNRLEQFGAFQQKKLRAQRAARFSPADVDNMTVSVLNDLAFRPRGQAGNRRRRVAVGGRRKSRQRESRWEVGESPGNVSRGGSLVQWEKQGLSIGVCKREIQCPSREPIKSGVLFGAEYSGELVTDGLENMGCGALQAVERLGGAACASRGRGGSSQLTRQNIARLNASTGDITSTVISPNGSVITTISRPSLRRRRRNSVASQRNLSPGSGVTVISNGNPRGLNMNIQKIIAAMQGKVFDPDSFPQTANILQRRRGAGMNTDFRPTPSISNMSMHERFAAVM
uniref:Uncharacterized protein n=1 Tax=Timema tahoe TaxID=61484 RepID=A0A7R9NWB2_9NEOP|nr:unnamed protein product [Timema tahoe]